MSAGVLAVPGAAFAQAPAAAKLDRPPDFVLITKKCVRLTSKLGGPKPPLAIDHPPGKREACWRSGADVTCDAGGSPITLRINRETGPTMFATAEGGLMMFSLDWSSSSFANGITYYDDEAGIAHVQCTGTVLSGPAAARAAQTPARGSARKKPKIVE
jgi:hypothetical protein